jgi:hypothetical protein
VNGDTPFEILEADIVREPDSLEVRGVDLDEAFSGLGPIRRGCDCAEAFAGTVWRSEIVTNACGTVGESSPFLDSTKDRIVKRE